MAKYEVLAHQLKEQIERGVWVENEKLPSLRKQAAQTGFSLMTVLHAYQMLESQGIVSSQERSGFLVTAKASNASKERVQATEAVSINDFVYEVLQASRDPHMFSLGFAYPDPSLYPRQHLNKSIAAAAQQISLTSAMDNLPPGNLDLRKIIAKRYAAKGVNIFNLNTAVLTLSGPKGHDIVANSRFIFSQQTAVYFEQGKRRIEGFTNQCVTFQTR